MTLEVSSDLSKCHPLNPVVSWGSDSDRSPFIMAPLLFIEIAD
jgi:hypothetical protein